MPNDAGGVTNLLRVWSDGDPAALDELMPLVYSELYRIARGYMADERIGHTLQPSALVSEAYMRLIEGSNVDWKSRRHFYVVSARVMRRILIDHARARNARKRSGLASQVTLDEAVTPLLPRQMDLIALDRALERLAEFDQRKSQVIELRIFGGLTIEETADVMSVAFITVRRDWTLALAWLRRWPVTPRSPLRQWPR